MARPTTPACSQNFEMPAMHECILNATSFSCCCLILPAPDAAGLGLLIRYLACEYSPVQELVQTQQIVAVDKGEPLLTGSSNALHDDVPVCSAVITLRL
jgi:hypothetical protein